MQYLVGHRYYSTRSASGPGVAEVHELPAHFDRAGLYAWHCHLVEHEDNEMMRPYLID